MKEGLDFAALGLTCDSECAITLVGECHDPLAIEASGLDKRSSSSIVNRKGTPASVATVVPIFSNPGPRDLFIHLRVLVWLSKLVLLLEDKLTPQKSTSSTIIG